MPLRSDGVTSNQSLPSFEGCGGPLPGSFGKSYSLNTTRAVSPFGRYGSVTFLELSPGPRARARYAASSF